MALKINNRVRYPSNGLCCKYDCKAFNNLFSNNCSALSEYIKHSGIGCPFYKTKTDYSNEVNTLKAGGHHVCDKDGEYELYIGSEVK